MGLRDRYLAEMERHRPTPVAPQLLHVAHPTACNAQQSQSSTQQLVQQTRNNGRRVQSESGATGHATNTQHPQKIHATVVQQTMLHAKRPGADLPDVLKMDAATVRFCDRRIRLMRWGWTEAEAEALAERLVQRDREHGDRVSCTDCQHYRPGRCGNHAAALLHSHEVGRDLAAMLQRCPGYRPEG